MAVSNTLFAKFQRKGFKKKFFFLLLLLLVGFHLKLKFVLIIRQLERQNFSGHSDDHISQKHIREPFLTGKAQYS